MKKVQLIYYIGIYLLIFIFIEIISYITIFHTNKLDRYFFHKYDFISKSEWDNYLFERDELIGWPKMIYANALLEENGSRKSPANNLISESTACIEVYGDSFGYDTSVSDDEAWPNQLAEMINCKVFNMGIPGYGIDQMLLRFERDSSFSKKILLTFIDGDYRRSLTRMYSLMNGVGLTSHDLTKPMFKLNKDDQLELINLPINSYDEYLSLKDEKNIKNVFGDDEYFLPGNSNLWSFSLTSFPYTLNIIEILYKFTLRQFAYAAYMTNYSTYKFLDKIDGLDFFKSFSPVPPSYTDDAIKFNHRLIYEFLDLCDYRKLECFIVPLPYISDFNIKHDSRVVENLKKDPIISEKLINIDKICLLEKFENKGILKKQIQFQILDGHYNKISSEVIAFCIKESLF